LGAEDFAAAADESADGSEDGSGGLTDVPVDEAPPHDAARMPEEVARTETRGSNDRRMKGKKTTGAHGR
jgi:hypothetical protein